MAGFILLVTYGMIFLRVTSLFNEDYFLGSPVPKKEVPTNTSDPKEKLSYINTEAILQQ